MDNIPSNSSTPVIPNRQRSIVFIAVALLSLLAGFVLGYQIRTVSAIPTIPKEQAAKEAAVARNVIFKPQEEWGEIVTEPFMDLRLDGVITNIEDGAIRGGEPGVNVTIAKESDKATVFVSSRAEVYQGKDIRQVKDWVSSDVASLKIGDMVTVRVKAPVNESLAPPSFRGWWVFKHL